MLPYRIRHQNACLTSSLPTLPWLHTIQSQLASVIFLENACMFQPQGLCTYCFFYSEHSSPVTFMACSSHHSGFCSYVNFLERSFPITASQIAPSDLTCPPPPSLSLLRLLPYFALIPSSYTFLYVIYSFAFVYCLSLSPMCKLHKSRGFSCFVYCCVLSYYYYLPSVINWFIPATILSHSSSLGLEPHSPSRGL